MRRFRLYWDGGMRSNNSAEYLLDWAGRCLPNRHANLFDGEKYICTIKMGELGTAPTYSINDFEVGYNDIIALL